MLPYYHEKLLNAHAGEDAFVVGAGTSLNGLDLSLIHSKIVIAVNSAIMLMPWSDGEPDYRYWVSNDALCRIWSWWPLVLNAKATKVVRDSWSKYFDELKDKNFYQFAPRIGGEGYVADDDMGLCRPSSVPSGIDLAIKMGCKRIFLLGVDQYMDRQKSHYWQYWPKDKQPKRSDMGMADHAQQRWTFGYNDICYRGLAKFAERKGAEVFNCNPKSRVSAFPKIEFETATEMVK